MNRWILLVLAFVVLIVIALTIGEGLIFWASALMFAGYLAYRDVKQRRH